MFRIFQGFLNQFEPTTDYENPPGLGPTLPSGLCAPHFTLSPSFLPSSPQQLNNYISPLLFFFCFSIKHVIPSSQSWTTCPVEYLDSTVTPPVPVSHLCLFPSAHKPVPPSHAYNYNKGANKKCKTSLLPMRLFLTRFTKLARPWESPGPLFIIPRHFPLDMGLAGVRQGVGIGVTGQVWETLPFNSLFCVCRC